MIHCHIKFCKTIAYEWLKSYLNDRYQFVQIGKDKSTLKHIISEVPKGFILGPLMFLVYINDLPLISHGSCFILFADDTTSLTPCLHNTDIQTLINNESSLIVDWFASNHLALNVNKCKYIFFTLKHNVVNVPLVIYNNLHIECEYNIKFLGCIIDDRLNWHEYIYTLCNKIAKGIAMLYSSKNSFLLHVKRMLYYAYIYSHLTYCMPI